MIIGGSCMFEVDTDQEPAARHALAQALMEFARHIDTSKLYHISFETDIVNAPIGHLKEYRVLIRAEQYRKE